VVEVVVEGRSGVAIALAGRFVPGGADLHGRVDDVRPVVVDDRQHGVEVARQDDVVVVEEHHEVAVGGVQPRVPGGRRAEVVGVRHEFHAEVVAERCEHLAHVGTAVVDDHDLNVLDVLRPQARQRVRQRLRPVRRGDDDADLLIHPRTPSRPG
jgi:hypothetical protein